MFYGFNNRRKHNTVIGGGDWDRDGVKNRKDCSPLNHKKQDKCVSCGENFSRYHMIKKEDGMYCEDCSRDSTMKNKMGQVLRW